MKLVMSGEYNFGLYRTKIINTLLDIQILLWKF